jgi:integrase
MAVVRRWIGKHEEFVFVRTDGQQVRGLPTNTWTLALKKAGLQNFKWHDLRHTWASLLRQSGKVGLDLLQELGGWKSAKMVQRYAHLSVEHLASSADVLDAVLSPSSGREKVFAIR